MMDSFVVFLLFVTITTTSAFTPLSSSPKSLRLSSTAAVKNPFQQLPWNIRKEQERQNRRLEQERAILHRQLGIPEDATYEEIVEATERAISMADVKQKIRIEVAKDKILQHRLNERLAGYRQANKDARAQSMFEQDNDEDDDKSAKSQVTTRSAPAWTQGLVVKPDRAHIINQVRLWGIITFLGAVLPPVQDYLQRFTWLICVAQLTFRGMPSELRESGGMGMSFNSGGGGKGHRKIAFLLGFLTWIGGSVIAYGFLPKWARAQRWTNTVAFGIQNVMFGLVSSYLQPYKG